MWVVFIICVNIWNCRKAGHSAQLKSVRLELGSLNNRPNEQNQQPVAALETSDSRSAQQPGEVAGGISKTLLEVSSGGSKNIKPDETQTPSHASIYVEHIESSPHHLPNRDRLRNENMSQANCFALPTEQLRPPTQGPPLRPGHPVNLEQVAEGHMAEPPADPYPPPPSPPHQPVEPPSIPPPQPDAPSEAADLVAAAEATPLGQQFVTFPINAQAQETTSNGTSVPV